MKFEHTNTYNFEGALRGMRNALESWDKGDSFEAERFGKTVYVIGENDMNLCKRLIKAGPSHRKFLRQIGVSVDITAPLYWWKEFDTYKVGTVANSTSTMHKIQSKPITFDCFERDDFVSDLMLIDEASIYMRVDQFLDDLEQLRQLYLQTKDKRYWKELIRWLPNGWLQTRTVALNYEVIRNIIEQRSSHKLNEWSGRDNPEKENFIKWARSLPYAKELLFDEE